MRAGEVSMGRVMTDDVITRVPRAKVHAPQLFDYEKKSRHKNPERDQFLRENNMIDSAILAAELGKSEAFVHMLQRRAGLRKLAHHRKISKYP